MNADGFITITDRMKDILITAGGKNVAPIHIEGMLKEDPLISQVVVYGDRKKYLTAIITLDEERKAQMVSNLLVVLCSERGTQPVVNAGTLYG